MASNIKLGVDLADFKNGIREGQNILKGLNAEMKATEAEFEATGNAEQQLAAKTKNLNSQLQVQKGIADQAQKALKAMEDAGIKPTDAAYQKMYATMMNAKAGMNQAQVELNKLGTEAGKSAEKTKTLKDGLDGISKKISLDQVISGIEKISSGMEKAAKSAAKVGKFIMTETLGAANWADELATTAKAYGISTDELQRMEKTAQIIDTSVDDILNARQNLGKNGSAVNELFGIETEGRSIEDVFWETGEAIMAMGDAFKQEEAARKIFGKGWRDLVPLFTAGREEYERVNSTWKTVSDEQLESLTNLDDQYQTLKADLETLKLETLSQLAEPIAGIMEKFNEFLQSDQGKQVISDVLGAIKGSLEWITQNSGAAVGAITALAGAFGLLKVTDGVLSVVKFLDGVKSLSGKDAVDEAGKKVITTSSGLDTATDMTFWSKFGALGLTGAMMLSPAIIAKWARDLIPDEYKLESDAFVKSSKYSPEDVKNVREYAKTVNEISQMEEHMFDEGFDQQRYEELSARRDSLAGATDTELWRNYWLNYVQNQDVKGKMFDLSVLDEMIAEVEGQGGVPVKVDPQAPADSAQKIAGEVGTVVLPVELAMGGISGMINSWFFGKRANGLPYVPHDGLALLHRGERVLTASANRNYTANSNLYVENMNMNNGMDAQALAAAMSAQNRRISAGFGS